MKHFPTLLSHEIRMLLVSPVTYVAATLFLLGTVAGLPSTAIPKRALAAAPRSAPRRRPLALRHG